MKKQVLSALLLAAALAVAPVSHTFSMIATASGNNVSGNNTARPTVSAGDAGNSGTESETTGETEDTNNDTVTSASGEKLSSAAAINVKSTIAAAVRTPQSAVNAAVGNLREGQFVLTTVTDSQCGELARQAVTNAASSVSGRVAAYLEITLEVCNSDGGVAQNITWLSTPIEITIAVPEGIDGNQHDFAVVRLHEGKTDILPDLDSDPSTITFRTDRFSVYAVIYGDKGAFGSVKKDSVPKTGDSTIPVMPFAAAGAACAAAAFALKKSRHREKSAGNVS